MRLHAISAFLAILLIGTPLCAQRVHASMRISSSPRFGSGRHSRFPGSSFLGGPFWSDAYDDPSPNVIVVQPPPAPVEHASAPIEEHNSAPPLMIEWQGDRYVRRTSDSAGNSRTTQPDYVADTKSQPSEKNSGHATAPSEPRTKVEPPPTTFVFRDGHQEESSDYSIISGMIYARGDYWTSGSWSKQIPLSQLDLPATAKANQDRGAPFRLPTAHNEVITRP
jgi:hypothetical protein